MCDRIHLIYCCCSVTNRSSRRRRFRQKLQLQSETANYVKVVLLEVISLPRGPLFFVHPPSTNQLFFSSPHTENWTIISRIRGIILLSMRLDKGNFCNHELLLCKLIFCWHQGSTSPAKPSFSLRVGLAGGSLTISTQIVWSSLYQKSFISLTINSSGWLIEDIKWVVVGGEYLMIWMILILGMMWLFTAVFSHQQVQTQQRNVQQMIQTNYWHQIHASPNCVDAQSWIFLLYSHSCSSERFVWLSTSVQNCLLLLWKSIWTQTSRLSEILICCQTTIDVGSILHGIWARIITSIESFIGTSYQPAVVTEYIQNILCKQVYLVKEDDMKTKSGYRWAFHSSVKKWNNIFYHTTTTSWWMEYWEMVLTRSCCQM